MRTFLFLPCRFVFAGLAIAGLLLIGAGAGQAADPFVAGGRSTRMLPAGADDVARAKARGHAVAVALGLPGVSQRIVRLDDRFEHRSYDEVTCLDASGREVAIARLDLDGTVAMAVALGWRGKAGPSLDTPGAAKRAEALARAVGLVPAGRSTTGASAGAGGWSVAWQRVVEGAVVRGDGLRISLWDDGSFHGLTRTERPLAPAPGREIDPDQARATAIALIADRAGGSAGDLQIVAASRAWVAPNDTFGGSRLDAPAETLRLAWAVRLDASGDLAGRLRSVEVWVDAGDGSILGGDVIE